MLRVQSPLSASHEQLISEVIDCGYTVHKALGPGFRENIYRRALCLELDLRRLCFESEKRIEVDYKGWRIPGQTVDVLVGEIVLVEIKSVPALKELHRQQLLSYLRTMHLPVGLLMNFNTTLFKHGVRRVAA